MRTDPRKGGLLQGSPTEGAVGETPWDCLATPSTGLWSRRSGVRVPSLTLKAFPLDKPNYGTCGRAGRRAWGTIGEQFLSKRLWIEAERQPCTGATPHPFEALARAPRGCCLPAANARGRLEGQERLRWPPTPRRGSTVRGAGSIRRSTPVERWPGGVRSQGVAAALRLAQSPWHPGRCHPRRSGHPRSAKPTSDRARGLVLFLLVAPQAPHRHVGALE